MVEAKARRRTAGARLRARPAGALPGALVKSAAEHVKSVDVVASVLLASLIGTATVSLFGADSELAFGLSPGALILIAAIAFALVYANGARSRGDLTLARLFWLLLIVVPASVVFGLVMRVRQNSFFTMEALHQASLTLLVFAIIVGFLERRAAKGTPSDVLAVSSTNTAAFTLLVFWIFTAFSLHLFAVVIMLLAGLLLLLAMLLRLPGVVVPIYRARMIRRRRRRAARGES